MLIIVISEAINWEQQITCANDVRITNRTDKIKAAIRYGYE